MILGRGHRNVTVDNMAVAKCVTLTGEGRTLVSYGAFLQGDPLPVLGRMELRQSPCRAEEGLEHSDRFLLFAW